MSKVVRFSLNISPDEYLRYYRGTARWVHTRSEDGKTVQFPANLLQQHVTHNGICGHFILRYTEAGKVISLDRIC